MKEENLKFKIEVIGRAIVIRFRGEIDMLTATSFDDFMRCHIGKYEVFVIDMSLLDYFNSTGLGVILTYCRLCKMFIIPPTKKMLVSVMSLLNIGKYVSICDTMDEVFDNLKKEVNKNAIS